MISISRNKPANEDLEIKGKIYAFDSTTIDLCLNVFWWARFRKTKSGIKLHVLFDITTLIPAFIHITSAAVNDRNAKDYISYEEGAFYVFDRGYVDFFRLNTINQRKTFFWYDRSQI